MKRALTTLALAVAAIGLSSGSALADEHVSITLVHGIPGATVDVAVGGDVLLEGFEPGDTQDLTAFAGQTLADIEVRAAGTEDAVISVPELAVPAEGTFLVVAHLDADGAPTISPFELDDSPTADGQGRVTVIHAAAAPAVDLVVGDARPIENAANGAQAALDLPAGRVEGAQLAPTGGDPIIDVPAVDIVAGTNLAVLAVGSLEDDSFTFLTQSVEVGVEAGAAGDGTPAPTAVNTGNVTDSGADLALLAAAGGLFLLGGGAFALRRRGVTAGDPPTPCDAAPDPSPNGVRVGRCSRSGSPPSPRGACSPCRRSAAVPVPATPCSRSPTPPRPRRRAPWPRSPPRSRSPLLGRP